MSNWRLEFLGSPHAIQGEMVVSRLRSRKAWAVLASLLLSPSVHSRRDLALRFWPDVDEAQARKSLREALFSLRQALGAEVLDEDRETVRWRGSVDCDVQEFEKAYARSQTGDTDRQISALKAAADLVDGPFLNGVDDPEGYGWITQWRTALHQQGIEVLRRLVYLQNEAGDQAAAADTALQLLDLAPDDAVGKGVSLTCLKPAQQPLTESMSWGDAVDTLCEPNAPSRFLPRSERRILEKLIARKLGELDLEDRRSLIALSVFPDSFTSAQAEVICNVSPPDLLRLSGEHLLTQTKDRFLLHPPIRILLERRLTGEERKRLRKRHADTLYQMCETHGESAHDRHSPYFQTEARNLRHAMDWILSHEPTRQGVEFLEVTLNGWIGWNLEDVHDVSPSARAYLERASEIFEPRLAGSAAAANATLALYQRDFPYAQRCIERIVALHALDKDPFTFFIHIENLLTALHHRGDLEGFDRTLNLLAERPPDHLSDLQRARHNVRIWQITAENYLSRRRFEEALEYNAQVQEVNAAIARGPEFRAAAWSQRAFILRGLGRTDEAKACWNRALEDFTAANDRQGIANCYEQLGLLTAEEGQTVLGLSLVRDAIAMYDALGKAPSRAAAQATLASIHQLRGETDLARECLERGLAFWREDGHPRWIQRFEEGLARL